MPIFVNHDSQLANDFGMAANAGGFATGQVLHQNDLQDAANARANDAQALGVYGEILRDKQLNDRLDQQERIAGQHGDEALQRAVVGGEYGLKRAQVGNQGRVDV